MNLKTRGSAALDKAQRRLALLKGIDANLDLGNGFTIDAYTQLIDQTRNHLEAHNTLLSDLVESRQVMTQMDASLSDFSERMLSGVAIKYGKKSVEYAKAGGSYRKRGSQPASPTVAPLATATQTLAMSESVSQTRNGQVAQPALT